MNLTNIKILSVLPLLGHPRDSKRITMLEQAGFTVEAALGHLCELLVDTIDSFEGVDLIIINHRTVDAQRVNGWLEAGIRVIDLVDIEGLDRNTPGYEGIAW